MTEKQLLKKLDIPDWRHLSKDKVAVFANNFYKLDPEVAKAVLAQFPKFSETSLELVNQLNAIFKESSSSVKDIDTQVLQSIQSTIEWLQTELPNASDELKPKIIDTIVELLKDQRSISESHKRFHLEMFKTAGTIILGFGAALGVGLGSYFALSNSKQTTNDTEDDSDCIDI
nr:MAG TPA: hypothetical protein [Caudoviricetes sp.]